MIKTPKKFLRIYKDIEVYKSKPESFLNSHDVLDYVQKSFNTKFNDVRTIYSISILNEENLGEITSSIVNLLSNYKPIVLPADLEKIDLEMLQLEKFAYQEEAITIKMLCGSASLEEYDLISYLKQIGSTAIFHDGPHARNISVTRMIYAHIPLSDMIEYLLIDFSE